MSQVCIPDLFLFGVSGHTDCKIIYRIIIHFCCYLWKKDLIPGAADYNPALDKCVCVLCMSQNAESVCLPCFQTALLILCCTSGV